LLNERLPIPNNERNDNVMIRPAIAINPFRKNSFFGASSESLLCTDKTLIRDASSPISKMEVIRLTAVTNKEKSAKSEALNFADKTGRLKTLSPLDKPSANKM
jgi:hypothetical protein